MGADAPKPAGPETPTWGLVNALEYHLDEARELQRDLESEGDFERAAKLEFLVMDLPEVIRRLRSTPDGSEPVARRPVAMVMWEDHEGIQFPLVVCDDGTYWQDDGSSWKRLPREIPGTPAALYTTEEEG